MMKRKRTLKNADEEKAGRELPPRSDDQSGGGGVGKKRMMMRMRKATKRMLKTIMGNMLGMSNSSKSCRDGDHSSSNGFAQGSLFGHGSCHRPSHWGQAGTVALAVASRLAKR